MRSSDSFSTCATGTFAGGRSWARDLGAEPGGAPPASRAGRRHTTVPTVIMPIRDLRSRRVRNRRSLSLVASASESARSFAPLGQDPMRRSRSGPRHAASDSRRDRRSRRAHRSSASAALRPVHHRDGHRPVQRHDRRGLHALEKIVEPEDLTASPYLRAARPGNAGPRSPPAGRTDPARRESPRRPAAVPRRSAVRSQRLRSCSSRRTRSPACVEPGRSRRES